jgi:hypothetical protein
MSNASRFRRVAALAAALLALMGAGFVVGRQLRPHAYTPPTIRPPTATFRFATQLSSFPGLPVLAPRR